MAQKGLLSLLHSLMFAAILLQCHAQDKKVYIVYMGDWTSGNFEKAQTHNSMLEKVTGSSSLASESLIYSYKSFNGFAAKMTDEEAQTFADMGEVISVIPNRIYDLHTTKSWDFIGLTTDTVGYEAESNVIVGVLDTGIWPEHESFIDKGLNSAPSKWKGKCASNNFTCTNKIIGARFYDSEGLFTPGLDFNSSRDSFGHGTHTASTAAGARVDRASFSGLANGTARGGSPGARIAVYKVCWTFGCVGSDILAGFDDAIADGVDIISTSLGSIGAAPYFQDPIAIGSFHAMRRGILTSSSAGNAGPYSSSVANYAPWILTVAASTINRKFVSQLVLGNGKVLNGLSINGFNLNGKTYPLIWGGDAADYSAGADSNWAKVCFPGSLSSAKAAGKIVVCEKRTDGTTVLLANGTGVIIIDDSRPDSATSYVLPATAISSNDGETVMEYIQSSENPTATILAGQTLDDVIAPSIVTFSSRGPNLVSPDILKPDVTAPGVDILAAWPIDGSNGINHFNIISGTSMSCPHVSGAAAYVKAAHPTWSPAAVKSALMTTATTVDSRKHNELEFAYGSGQINPQKALDPGLVYDAQEGDYINFLCKQGYNDTTIRFIAGDNTTSCINTQPGRGWDLNYPSFTVAVEDGNSLNASLPRTVTNVGSSKSTYTVQIQSPSLFEISVQPSTLDFSAVGEKKTFTLSVVGPRISQQPITSGAIIWSDGIHQVRSPVVVYTVLPGATSASISSSKFLKVSELEDQLMQRKNEILHGEVPSDNVRASQSY